LQSLCRSNHQKIDIAQYLPAVHPFLPVYQVIHRDAEDHLSMLRRVQLHPQK